MSGKRPLHIDVERFAESMREQGIHVGRGQKPYCVTCGDPWPCRASLEKPDG